MLKNKNTLMKFFVIVIMLFVFIFWILYSYVFKKNESKNENNIFKNEELQNLKKDFSDITDNFF
jgi:preprotein translocase subunit SecG